MVHPYSLNSVIGIMQAHQIYQYTFTLDLSFCFQHFPIFSPKFTVLSCVVLKNECTIILIAGQ